MLEDAKQLVKFAAIGSIGFFVDVGALYLATSLGSGLYMGRVASFLLAVTFTWYLNRRFTFSQRAGKNALNEWASFVLSQLSGAAFNFGTYALLIHFFASMRHYLWMAIACGSLAGMAINFTTARMFVFKGESIRE